MRLAIGVTAALFIVAVLALPAASADAQTAGFSESKVTVKGKEAICHDGMVPPKKLSVSNLAGEPIKRAAAGLQMLLQATIENNCDVDGHPVTIIFEVRDSDGVTKYLTIQQTNSSPTMQTITAGSSWTAKDPGQYTARVMSISCPTCTGVLLSILSYDFSAY